MTFLWGFILGFFTAGMCFSRKFRAGVKTMLKGLGRGFMKYRKWAIAQGTKSDKAKRGKAK